MNPINIMIAPEIKTILPQVLIDYLCNLLPSNENGSHSEQIFELCPDKLNGQRIQNIFYCDNRRRVFGFSPVSCKLRVINSADQYQMMLAN